MSQWTKLLNRVLSLSSDIRFKELQKILEHYGYTMYHPQGGSSHYTFRKNGCFPITIPKHNTIKKVYIEMVKDLIESEEKKNEES